MSGAKLLPFKERAEERSAKIQAGVSTPGEAPAPAAKKPCTAYEKQFAKMDGDITFIKDGFLG
jgi:hypothetical protein